MARVVTSRAGAEPATTSATTPAVEMSIADEDGRLLRLLDGRLDHAFQLAGLLLEDAGLAEVAAREALSRAWRAAEHPLDRDDPSAWFDRLVVNVCRDELRWRRLGRLVPPDEAEEVRGVDPFRRCLEQDELLRPITALDLEERAAVVLHYWSNLSLAAVAVRLNVPVETVKSRLSRSLRAIRIHLAERPAWTLVTSADLDHRLAVRLRAAPLPAATPGLRDGLADLAAEPRTVPSTRRPWRLVIAAAALLAGVLLAVLALGPR